MSDCPPIRAKQLWIWSFLKKNDEPPAATPATMTSFTPVATPASTSYFITTATPPAIISSTPAATPIVT